MVRAEAGVVVVGAVQRASPPVSIVIVPFQLMGFLEVAVVEEKTELRAGVRREPLEFPEKEEGATRIRLVAVPRGELRDTLAVQVATAVRR